MKHILVGVVMVGCVACGDDSRPATSDGTGAEGGEAAAGGGGEGGVGGDDPIGGTGAGGDGPECPIDAPQHQAPCDTPAELECSYPLRSRCDATIEASCVDGQWDALRPIGCEPVGTACDPTGEFSFEYGEWSFSTGTRVPPPYAPSGLILVTDAAGFMFTNLDGAELSEDGCSLSANWIGANCSDNEGEEFCTEHSFDLAASFSDDPPSGQLDYQCSGECDGTASAPFVLAPLD